MNKYFNRGLLTFFVISSVFAFGALVPATPVSAKSMTLCQLVDLLITLGVITPDKVDTVRIAMNCSATVVRPSITLSQNSFNFSANQGDTKYQQKSLTVTNTGNANISFKISVPNQPNWLNTGYNTDTIIAYPNNPVGIGASLDPMGLSVGEYSTNIILTGDFQGSPITIPVTANILSQSTSASSLKVKLISQSIVGYKDGDESAAGTFKFNATAVNNDVYVYISQKDSSLDVLKNGVFVNSPSAVALNSTADVSRDFFLVKEGDTETFTLTYVIKPTQGTGYYSARATSIMLKDSQKVYLKGFESNKIYLQVYSTSTQPSITVLSPNGGESFTQGSKLIGSFNTNVPVGNNFMVSLNGKGYNQTLYNGRVTASDKQSFSFTVPNDITPGSTYSIGVDLWFGDVLLHDQSNNNFTIIASTTTTPYIISVTPVLKVGDTMSVDGLRLSAYTYGTKPDVYIDSKSIYPLQNGIAGDTKVEFTLPSLSIGSHYIEFKNESGMSNRVGFTVTETIQPSITAPAAPQRLTVSCIASPNPVALGSTITWTAYPQGGTGQYSYVWGGDATNHNVTHLTQHFTAGTISNTVAVTSGTQTANASCSVVVVQSSAEANNVATENYATTLGGFESVLRLIQALR